MLAPPLSSQSWGCAPCLVPPQHLPAQLQLVMLALLPEEPCVESEGLSVTGKLCLFIYQVDKICLVMCLQAQKNS